MRAYLIAIALLLAIFGSLGGYLYLQQMAIANADYSEPPVTVASAVSQAERWDGYLDAVGSIRAVRGVDLTSETAGEITAINFDSGDQAQAGTVLMVLNDEVEQAARLNEIATLELAEILYERDRKLIEQQSIPETQFDQSRADLARARAQLAETEARIRNKRIHAPFAGTLGIRRVELGDYVSPVTVIATLQDKSELEIDFTVPARFAPKLAPGQPIELTVPAFPDKIFRAQLAALDSRVDPNTRNILLRARLIEHEGLLPGMFATLKLLVERNAEVITVPETAVTYSLQGDIVYVVEGAEGGKLTAVSRVVQVGDVRDGRVAISEGLNAGEEIVTVGQNKLYRGVTIVIDESVVL
ncbi:MAG: efflux RND transporter periplasmic adaptor subunit [Pseudomonadota bacterium]